MNSKNIISNSKNIVSEDKFNNKWGFVISCIGSSVGMANIWMFPYRIGEFGGAAFLIPYIIFVLLIGFTGVIGEMAFGRAMHSGPLGAFKKAFDMKTPDKNSRIGTIIGLIPVIGSLGIAIGYSVIIGWILKFLVDSITGTIVNDEDPAQVFTVLSRNFGSIPWHLLGLVFALLCMSFGIARGIEKINRIMMPAFFILFLCLAIRVAFLDGSADGYAYLFKPDWSAMADPQTWVYAMGQAFFSLSIAGSGTVVYGSYLKSDVDIVSSAKYVAFFDTLAALLAGLVIIPALILTGVVAAAVGLFVEGDLLSPWMDTISIYVIPLGALLAGITMFWVCGKTFARNAVQLGRKRTLGRWFEPMTRYVFCGVALVVYVLGIFFGGIG